MFVLKRIQTFECLHEQEYYVLNNKFSQFFALFFMYLFENISRHAPPSSISMEQVSEDLALAMAMAITSLVSKSPPSLPELAQK